MLPRGIFFVAFAVIFLSAVFVQHSEGGKIKKIIFASVIANALKPRFIPIPLPVPFKLKINKGEKIVPYPVYSNEMMYGGGGYGGGGNEYW